MRNLIIFMLGIILLQRFPLKIYSRRIVMAHYRLNSSFSDAEESRSELDESATSRDVSSLSECALRSRQLSKRAFFYNMETMECVPNPRTLARYGASAGLHQYVLVVKKGRKSLHSVKACYYKMEKKPIYDFELAKTICRNKDGYLLEINTKEENDFIKKQFTESIWLGASGKNNTFTWDSGAPVEFLDTMDLSMQNNPVRSNKVCLAVTQNGWRVARCSFDSLYVVCEYHTCIH